MALTMGEKIQHAFNIFTNKEDVYISNNQNGGSNGSVYSESFGSSMNTSQFGSYGNMDKYMISSIYNRMALDVASLDFKHIRVDEKNQYVGDMKSGLNDCLTFAANIDQTSRLFILDAAFSLLQEGCIAIVPIDTDIDAEKSNSYDILSLRVGKIEEWRTKDVKVSVYNDETGRRQPIWVRKDKTAIIENPFYAVMNAPNSTLKCLSRKLNILDAIDSQSGSGKLDIIIQVPFVVRGEAKKKQAAERKKEIEEQLNNSKYGIAYIDAAEHIIQLNRPVDNSIMEQVKYLTDLAYSQLGITQEIMNGTADAETMTKYNARIIEPIAAAIVDSMRRAFLTKTARTQGQSIGFFRDPFKLIEPMTLAEVSDKLTRNEIVTANEVRPKIGMAPSDDPGADELRNKNISKPSDSDISPTTDEGGN